MSPPEPAPGSGPRRPDPGGDGWSVLAYLLTGMVLYGGLGLLVDHLLGTEFFVLVGLLAGATGAMWLIWVRYGRQ